MGKVIGSIIVIAVCTVLGFEKSKELQQHLTDLEELKKIFVLLKSELQYTRAPIAEVLGIIGKKTVGIYQMWLVHLAKSLNQCGQGTLRNIWEESVRKYLKECRLTKEEMEELCRVGNGLGHIESLDLYLSQLDISIENAREELKCKKKLYQTIGIMGGIFLVIVLL